MPSGLGDVKVKVDAPSVTSATVTDQSAPDVSDVKLETAGSADVPSKGDGSSVKGRPRIRWGTTQGSKDAATAEASMEGAKASIEVTGKPPMGGGGSATPPKSGDMSSSAMSVGVSTPSMSAGVSTPSMSEGGVQMGEGSMAGMSTAVTADMSKPSMTSGGLDASSASVSPEDQTSVVDDSATPIMRLPASKQAPGAAEPSGTFRGSSVGTAPIAARSPAASAYVASITTPKSSEGEPPRTKRAQSAGKVSSYVQAIETKHPSPAIKREDAAGGWSGSGRAKVEVIG